MWHKESCIVGALVGMSFVWRLGLSLTQNPFAFCSLPLQAVSMVHLSSQRLSKLLGMVLCLTWLLTLLAVVCGSFFPYSGGDDPRPKRIFLQVWQEADFLRLFGMGNSYRTQIKKHRFQTKLCIQWCLLKMVVFLLNVCVIFGLYYWYVCNVEYSNYTGTR